MKSSTLAMKSPGGGQLVRSVPIPISMGIAVTNTMTPKAGGSVCNRTGLRMDAARRAVEPLPSVLELLGIQLMPPEQLVEIRPIAFRQPRRLRDVAARNLQQL